jgi:hypothetical protein
MSISIPGLGPGAPPGAGEGERRLRSLFAVGRLWSAAFGSPSDGGEPSCISAGVIASAEFGVARNPAREGDGDRPTCRAVDDDGVKASGRAFLLDCPALDEPEFGPLSRGVGRSPGVLVFSLSLSLSFSLSFSRSFFARARCFASACRRDLATRSL